MIHAREENPPPDTEAVEWFLLTTIELGSPEAQRPGAAPQSTTNSPVYPAATESVLREFLK